MPNKIKQPFYEIDIDNSIITLLFCISFAVCLSGVANAFLTSIIVNLYELIFIISYYYTYNKKIPALSWWNQTKTLKILSIAWILLITLSLSNVISSTDNINHQVAACLKLYFIIIHILFATCLSSYIHLSRQKKTSLLEAIPFAIAIIAAILWFTINYIIPSNNFSFSQNPPLASNIRHIGYICTVSTTIITLKLLISTLRYGNTALLLALSIINFSLLLWLGGRTAIVAVLICLILSSILLKAKSDLKLVNLLLLLIVAGLSFLIAHNLAIFPWNGPIPFNHSIDSTLSEESLNRFSSGRLDIWILSISATLESPWLGLGPEGYLFLPNRSFGIQPHNLFVQIFLEWGILGGGVFIILLSYGLLKCLIITLNSSGQEFNACLIAFMVIISLTLHSLTDGTYYHAQPLFYLALSFAVFPSIAYSRSNNLASTVQVKSK